MPFQQREKKAKDEWLTPPEIIKACGEFDLDPCAPTNRPWDTAKKHLHIDDDGLKMDWDGRVWLNPPYGKDIVQWMERLARHNNGVALIFVRSETDWFYNYVLEKAISIFLIKGRLKFYNVDGTEGKYCAPAPSCLVAYGELNDKYLKELHIKGKYIKL